MNYVRKNSSAKATTLSRQTFDFAQIDQQTSQIEVPKLWNRSQLKDSVKLFCLLGLIFLPCVLFSQTSNSLQVGKLIYSGTFKGGLYTYGKEDAAVQEKVQKIFEEACIARSMDEWDPNVSESWSITKSNFPNQPIAIITDSTQLHFMMCKLHAEFYPKSGTKVMDAYLLRQQKSIENEKKLRADLSAKKITGQEASKAINLLDADIWGAPSHIELFTNHFPLSDSTAINISTEGFNCKEIKVDGAAYATTCMQTNYGNTFQVTTIYLGNYSQDKNGHLQLQYVKSQQWEKQHTIKIKVYGPVDVALLLLKKFDLEKLKSLLN